jgi:hypothetical protein
MTIVPSGRKIRSVPGAEVASVEIHTVPTKVDCGFRGSDRNTAKHVSAASHRWSGSPWHSRPLHCIASRTTPGLKACVLSPPCRFLGSVRGYAVPRFVRDDYLASYEGDRLTRSAALVRAYPKDMASLATRLSSIEVPVAIVVGRNDPYGLARDAELLRKPLPHARLDVLEAGHCVWEERAPEFESIVTQWIRGGFQAQSFLSSPAGRLVRRSLRVTLRTSGPTARIQPRSDRVPQTAAADGSSLRRR